MSNYSQHITLGIGELNWDAERQILSKKVMECPTAFDIHVIGETQTVVFEYNSTFIFDQQTGLNAWTWKPSKSVAHLPNLMLYVYDDTPHP
jgi:antibiotic biosynthesis monooxygenase (ABM) superfamily enzyme